MHTLCCDTCHSHVARALNIMQYDGSTRSSNQHKNMNTNTHTNISSAKTASHSKLFSQTKQWDIFLLLFVQLEHGDPVRVDVGPWEARELVREYFPFLDTVTPQIFFIKIFTKSSWKVRHGAHLAALPRPPWSHGCANSPDQPNPGVALWLLFNILTKPTLWQLWKMRANVAL